MCNTFTCTSDKSPRSCCMHKPNIKIYIISYIFVLICLEHDHKVFTPSVNAIIFGFHSPIDKIGPEHTIFLLEESRSNFITVSESDEMLDYLIKHFSNEGDTVLDMMQLKGMTFYLYIHTLIPQLNYMYTYLNMNEKHFNEH